MELNDGKTFTFVATRDEINYSDSIRGHRVMTAKTYDGEWFLCDGIRADVRDDGNFDCVVTYRKHDPYLKVYGEQFQVYPVTN